MMIREERLIETPLKVVFEVIIQLAQMGDVAGLLKLRLKLLDELLEDAREDGDLQTRLRGAQWQFEQRYRFLETDDDRISFIRANFWAGAEMAQDPQRKPVIGSF